MIKKLTTGNKLRKNWSYLWNDKFLGFLTFKPERYGSRGNIQFLKEKQKNTKKDI